MLSDLVSSGVNSIVISPTGLLSCLVKPVTSTGARPMDMLSEVVLFSSGETVISDWYSGSFETFIVYELRASPFIVPGIKESNE